MPAYIPENDANILASSRKTAYRLDCCLFNFLGIRFGWSSVIGIVPAAGDAVDLALSAKLVKNMTKIDGGLPSSIFMMMVVNLLVDFIVGLIPFVGDLADAAIRANSRNVRLLEKHLDQKYKPKQLREEEDRYVREGGRRPRPATVYEDFSDEEEERADFIREGREDVQQPARAYSSRRERRRDEEMGYGRDDRRDDRPSRNNTKSSRR